MGCYVLLRFLSRASQWAHSFTRLFAIVRAGLWQKFDLMICSSGLFRTMLC